MNSNRKNAARGFTLVEILIVVIILGILAAIVIPQFAGASNDARTSSMVSQLQTVRSQIEFFKLQHGDHPPLLITNPNWADLIGTTTYNGASFGPYLQSAPVNPLTNSSVVATSASLSAGWVYIESSGTFSGILSDGTFAPN